MDLSNFWFFSVFCFQLSKQPGSGEAPITADGCHGDVESFSMLAAMPKKWARSDHWMFFQSTRRRYASLISAVGLQVMSRGLLRHVGDGVAFALGASARRMRVDRPYSRRPAAVDIG
jgi:hypothetical protein